jgi:hypothetical protein
MSLEIAVEEAPVRHVGQKITPEVRQAMVVHLQPAQAALDALIEELQ